MRIRISNDFKEKFKKGIFLFLGCLWILSVGNITSYYMDGALWFDLVEKEVLTKEDFLEIIFSIMGGLVSGMLSLVILVIVCFVIVDI